MDKHFFGVEVVKVKEVFPYQEMTRVPLLANRVVRGMINLRGQIIAAIELLCRLEKEARPEDTLPMNVVVRTDAVQVTSDEER